MQASIPKGSFIKGGGLEEKMQFHARFRHLHLQGFGENEAWKFKECFNQKGKLTGEGLYMQLKQEVSGKLKEDLHDSIFQHHHPYNTILVECYNIYGILQKLGGITEV